MSDKLTDEQIADHETNWSVDVLAGFMHEKYQVFADEEGWNVQRKTNVAFEDLPEANQRVMLKLAGLLWRLFYPRSLHDAGLLAIAEAALREQIEEYDGFSEDAVTLRRVIDIAHRALQDMEKK